MEYRVGHEAVDARAQIAQLRRSVRAWMDGDQVLPADGASLLAALGRALAGLTAENAAAAPAGITAFTGQVQRLIEAGVLDAADGRPVIEAAVTISTGLVRGEETDLGGSRRGETALEEQR